MSVMSPFLAAISAANLEGGLTETAGFSWWQTIGGLVIVFGLLILCLKLLGKWSRRTVGAESRLLTVWNLGPKREIQLLRLGEEVHYIYRHDGSMVVLRTEPVATFEKNKAAAAEA